MPTPPVPPRHAPYRAALSSVALIGTMLLGAGCTSRAERAAEAMAAGQQLAAAGQYGPAQGQFDIAIAARDDLPELWLLRARNQIALNDYAGAYGSFRNVLDQDRTNREALDAVSQLSLATGRLDDARDYSSQILALDPNNVGGLIVAATAAFRQGLYDQAEGQLKRALQLAPDTESALVLQSQFAMRRGRFDQAGAVLQPIFLKSGGSRDVRRQLMTVYEHAADAKGMLAVATRNVAAEGDDIAHRLTLARQMLLTGDRAGGAAQLNRIHATRPGDARRDATIAMLADADIPTATLAPALATLSEPDPDLTLALADYALVRQDHAVAERLLAPLIAGRPAGVGTADLYGARAHALAGLGRYGDAARFAAAALRFDREQTDALMARVLIQLAARKAASALRDVRIVAAENPDFAPGYALLRRALIAAGEPLLADRALFDAVNANRNDPVALRQLAAMLVANGRERDALDYARSFSLRNVASVAGWTIRGDLCRITGDNACVGRARAIVARLHGQSVPLPPVPADERTDQNAADAADVKDN
ncbi:tetratricopeptide repeat protein [Sphingomonas sp. CFBP 8760]|uniref:tetratricopeptide repeat protein n=1 Tax=Sphingomonas sp. CFBP 8760 TaxID=2775282 RepID=UPI00177DAD77|nr:tetratricopeptide repeat protein [Sphingomonas sp. CFBP 8760]MBD8548109.1 tetratricopeptide repeat protein [Sphingomonas sp. CFBP 8760]